MYCNWLTIRKTNHNINKGDSFSSRLSFPKHELQSTSNNLFPLRTSSSPQHAHILFSRFCFLDTYAPCHMPCTQISTYLHKSNKAFLILRIFSGIHVVWVQTRWHTMFIWWLKIRHSRTIAEPKPFSYMVRFIVWLQSSLGSTCSWHNFTQSLRCSLAANNWVQSCCRKGLTMILWLWLTCHS